MLHCAENRGRSFCGPQVVPPSLRKGKFRPPDKLLALLKGKP